MLVLLAKTKDSLGSDIVMSEGSEGTTSERVSDDPGRAATRRPLVAVSRTRATTLSDRPKTVSVAFPSTATMGEPPLGTWMDTLRSVSVTVGVPVGSAPPLTRRARLVRLSVLAEDVTDRSAVSPLAETVAPTWKPTESTVAVALSDALVLPPPRVRESEASVSVSQLSPNAWWTVWRSALARSSTPEGEPFFTVMVAVNWPEPTSGTSTVAFPVSVTDHVPPLVPATVRAKAFFGRLK